MPNPPKNQSNQARPKMPTKDRPICRVSYTYVICPEDEGINAKGMCAAICRMQNGIKASCRE